MSIRLTLFQEHLGNVAGLQHIAPTMPVSMRKAHEKTLATANFAILG
jgi:hypothetical protein